LHTAIYYLNNLKILEEKNNCKILKKKGINKMTKLEEEHLDIIEKTDWILDLHLKNLKMAIEMLQGNEEENKYLYMLQNKEKNVIDYMDLIIYSLEEFNEFLNKYIHRAFEEIKKEKAVNTKPLSKD
jgi:hypothetical protein